FVFLAGNHPSIYHVVGVVDQPFFQSNAHTFPNSCSNGVGGFGSSLGMASFARAAGVSPNSVASARICSANCFFLVINGWATLLVSAALLVYSTIKPSWAMIREHSM